jgi:hypothetical protein
MQLTLLKGYPDLIGRRQAFCGFGTGPASYSQTTGDVVASPAYERYFDTIHNTPQDPTGTYYAQARPAAVGPRAAWSLHWIVVATGLEVANAVNLSTFSLQVDGLMGEY